MSTGRARPYEVIFYGSLAELYKILRVNAERIAHYAFIYHDMDIYDEDVYEEDKTTLKHKKGDLKVPHFHVLVEYFNTHSFTAVKRMFTTDVDNPRVEKIVDRQAKFEYLIHKHYPEKYQYPYSAIVSDDITYYEAICRNGDRRDTDNIAEQIVRDLVKGVPPWVMISRYGRDYVIHRTQFQDMAAECKDWDQDHPKKGTERAKFCDVDDDEQVAIPFE